MGIPFELPQYNLARGLKILSVFGGFYFLYRYQRNKEVQHETGIAQFFCNRQSLVLQQLNGAKAPRRCEQEFLSLYDCVNKHKGTNNTMLNKY